MTMKKTLFLIMLLAIACINGLYSQMVLPIAFDSSNIANYDELVNECIEPLDKSLISSGILGEKVSFSLIWIGSMDRPIL